MKSIPLSRSRSIRRIVTFLQNRSDLERVLFWAIGLLTLIILILGIERISNHYSVIVPMQGGSISEGIVGFPERISPIFANNNAEYDLVKLVYSGLMRVNEEGEIAPHLAESYTVSEDGLVYTFKLREDALFHDGAPVTTADVLYTIESIKNPSFGSPQRVGWLNVEIEAQDSHTVEFRLSRKNAFFLEQLTVGIVPAHIWKDLTIDSLDFIAHSSYPIGSGPYRVKSVKRSESLGVPVQYTLTSFENYIDGSPFISKIDLFFFPNQAELIEAINKGRVKSSGFISPNALSLANTKNSKVVTAPMLRMFGLFFNQTEDSPLSERAVRLAIKEAIDQKKLAGSVFANFADVTYSPLPAIIKTLPIIPTYEAINEHEEDEEKKFLAGEKHLVDADWEMNPQTRIREKDDQELVLTISTAEGPEFAEVANFIKDSLQPLGFKVEIETFSVAELNQDIIRPRDYEVLLFGQAFDHTVDLYPFWHSSERDDPGLNVARYANSEVDKLVNELRGETDPDARQRLITKVTEKINEDIPAVFLYSPQFLYLADKQIKNISIPPVERSSDRFSNINEWYTLTEKIWKVFLKQKNNS